ncbi:hypothetical protein SDRG_07427 [Saprolegnia diclina VS20]|uniref:HMG box domain-containing protein n=1 Tax=Saprolegnia diclina (strain VS20) TaxID=1156394 RepID=T0RRS1_SAPDV|nr:hypothetical protein SDRG_07427 [Saprolegnia diclina VS20]EQC35198.1 hypothetical protein SDRG_07427 [Saprolegnia diclina VS20]|eukprot:XP_008611482.1 hypothetical protein SDRG_07427 [Saprolegnia diclina VS20]
MAKTTSTTSGVRPWRNAYLHFADGKRVEIVQAHPAWGNDAISRELGRLWKALLPSERAVWTNLAAYDRARYTAEAQVAATPSLLDMDLQSFMLTSSANGLDDAFSALDAQPTSPVVASLKRKHPNGAFFYFWRAQKAAVQAAHPTLLPQSLGKEMGRRWRALTRDEKQPWIALAAAEDAAAESSPKDSAAPKPPKHAFQLFLEQRRAANAHLSYNALTKESAALWRAMSSAEKTHFTHLAELEKARYEAEMRRYTPTRKSAKKRAAAMLPRTVVKKARRERAKYPKSAFVHYELENRRRYQDRPYNEYMVAIAKEWRELPETAKATWRALANDDVRRYEAEQAESDAGATTPETMSLNGASPRETLAGPLPTATSGFALFVHAKKHEFLATEPHLTHNDLVHKASKLWRSLAPNEKEPWRNLVQAPVTAAKKVELTSLDQLNLMDGLWDDEAHPGDDSMDMLDDATLAGLAKSL